MPTLTSIFEPFSKLSESADPDHDKLDTCQIVVAPHCPICQNIVRLYTPLFHRIIEIEQDLIPDRPDRNEILAAVQLNDGNLPVVKFDNGHWQSV
jgi:hypothetical protein